MSLTKRENQNTIATGNFSQFSVIKIRLQRTGRKKHPFYRIVAAEHSAPIKGKSIEVLGHYDPLSAEISPVFKKDRILEYIKNGAHPTQTVARLGVKYGIAELKKFIEERQMKPSKKELEEQKRKEEEAQKAKEEKEAAEAQKLKEEEEKAASEAASGDPSEEKTEEAH